MFVLVKVVNCWPGVPLVPRITRLEPDKLMLVMYGGRIAIAAMLPLTARLFAHDRPELDGKVTLLNEPAL